ncbi:MAG: sensor histidine kinase, partial [Pyrinomonadaceae bacterium]
MRISSRRKSIAFFITLGVCLVLLAVALNVTWILLNWRQVALLVLGIIFFVVIITGLVLNTIFLVREIRRNEQHDSFINAVTHELKTPIASIRLYLETLKTRDLDEARRREFYDIMLADADRLLHTVEQVLRAGRTGHRRRRVDEADIDLGALVGECVEMSRVRYNLDAGSI